MNSLEDLERNLDADLRRALAPVMRRLEEPLDPHVNERDPVPDGAPISLAGPDRRQRRHSRRWIVTAAAGALAFGGGVWLVRADQQRVPSAPVTSLTPATSATDATSTSVDASTSLPVASTVAEAYPLDGLEPVEAARMISISARIEPTPDERADLDVAGELLRRQCMRDGGATPPSITEADHRAVRDAALAALVARTDWYTTDGIEFIRTHGYFARGPAFDGDSTNDPLWMPIAEGSVEAQLLIDGCGTADEALRAGTAERALAELTIESNGGRWTSLALSPQGLPEYAEQYRTFDDCITAAGYPNYAELGETSAFNDVAGPQSSERELQLANADADCRVATHLPTVYVETLIRVLDEFDREYETERLAVRAERESALEIARATLIEYGIPPFTD